MTAFPHREPIVFHLVLASVLVLGAVFDDVLGRFLHSAGTALVLLACLFVLTGKYNRSETCLNGYSRPIRR